ncbi:MAG: hypothetical protein QOD67_142 [Caballeronia sp.]|jgi:hypothetical protein|nr:hypothetical protein [Caballeronia sp.]
MQHTGKKPKLVFFRMRRLLPPALGRAPTTLRYMPRIAWRTAAL